MANVIERAVIDAIRAEYVTAPERPTLRELAKKYGVAFRTIAERSRKEGWVAQRRARLQQLTSTVAAAQEKLGQAAADAYIEELEKTKKILRFVRDSSAKLYQLAYSKLVELAESGNLDKSELSRIAANAPRVIADMVKALELVSGRPTERTEVRAPQVELSAEEEEMLARLWTRISGLEGGEQT